MKSYLGKKMVTDDQQLLIGPGLFWGYGLFETMLIKNGQLIFFKEHYDRLLQSAGILSLQLDADYGVVKDRCEQAIRENKITNGALKMTLYKGQAKDHLLITTDTRSYSLQQYQEGFTLCKSQVKKNESSEILRHKTLQYLENILEKNKANQNGYDDALFFNTPGFVAETTTANIFFINDDKLFTPAIDTGVLPGVVREKVLQLAGEMEISVFEGFYSEQELMESDAVFITNSLLGLMPVRIIGKQEFSVNHPLLSELSKAYSSLLKKNPQKCFTYILECNDKTYYTGWTTDLHARTDAHNQGKGAKYTRGRGPVKLVYYEVFESKEMAMKKEAQIKKMTRQQKKALILECF